MAKRKQGQPPTLGPAHKKLAVFVGKWHAEGKSYGEGQSKENPYDSAVRWCSEETYEWLEGGFFLVHHWDARLGDRAFIGIELIGYDESSGEYFARPFDNSGFCPDYRLNEGGDTWTITGESQRATVLVGDDGNSMTFHWEWKNNGSDWLPLCDRKAVKVQ